VKSRDVVCLTGVSADERDFHDERDFYDDADEQIVAERETATPEQCSLITSAQHEVTQSSGMTKRRSLPLAVPETEPGERYGRKRNFW